jgi:hypothetical protein
MEKEKIRNNEIVVIERPLFTLTRNEQSLILGGNDFEGDDDALDMGSCRCKKGRFSCPGYLDPTPTCMCKNSNWIETY